MIIRLKIKALAKYEIVNLKRGILVWIIPILYAIGVQQAISSMHFGGNWRLMLVGFIKVSWLPLNFIMIPLLLISMKIGKSENDIFNAIDISPKEKMLGKIASVSIINGIVFAANITLFIILGMICKVPAQYFLYQGIGYIINSIIFLIVCSSLGMLIGQTVCKHVGDVLPYIIVVILFIFLCNFYKVSNDVVPLIYLRTFSFGFDVIEYSKSYLYNNLFWLSASFIFTIIAFMHSFKKDISHRCLVLQKCLLLIVSFACVFSIIGIYTVKPVYYNITNRIDTSYSNNSKTTYFGKEDCGYYVDKYNMNMDIDNGIKNNCTMEIKITGTNINSIELGLYEKLYISDLHIDGEKMNFTRTGHSFIVKLPREYNEGQIIKMNINYHGKINTTWVQGEELFFVRNNAMFLADVFEWYPKLNDSMIKQYNVEIKYNSKNKIYSNLNETVKSGDYVLTGEDRELCLISGNIIQRKYKGYLLIGNEEYISSNSVSDELIGILNRRNLSIKKIIESPFIPGMSKMDKDYQNVFLWTVD